MAESDPNDVDSLFERARDREGRGRTTAQPATETSTISETVASTEASYSYDGDASALEREADAANDPFAPTIYDQGSVEGG